mmetsp:Transcript_17068/g.43005  ORF Transcript_17068/g.43005 Transcript_17068/m.43005 type:complete len:235 (-) Transcript_17068:1217-1921(-)
MSDPSSPLSACLSLEAIPVLQDTSAPASTSHPLLTSPSACNQACISRGDVADSWTISFPPLSRISNVCDWPDASANSRTSVSAIRRVPRTFGSCSPVGRYLWYSRQWSLRTNLYFDQLLKRLPSCISRSPSLRGRICMAVLSQGRCMNRDMKSTALSVPSSALSICLTSCALATSFLSASALVMAEARLSGVSFSMGTAAWATPSSLRCSHQKRCSPTKGQHTLGTPALTAAPV